MGRDFLVASRPRPESERLSVAIPYYAGIDLHINGVKRPSTRVVSRAIPYPPLPQADSIPISQYYALAGSIRDPHQYLRQLRSFSLMGADSDAVVSFDASDVGRLLIPYRGRVVVASSFSDKNGKPCECVPTNSVVECTPGEVSSAHVLPHEKIPVAGLVVGPSGAPLPGVRVTVACKSVFGEGNPVPRSPDESGSPGFVMVSDRGMTSGPVIAQLSRIADAHGRFSVPMPFTDEIAVWAFVDGFRAGYLEEHLGDPGATPIELTLRLQRARVREYIRIVDEVGSPIANAEILPVEFDPPHEFQMKYPSMRSDDTGRVESTWLKERRYYFFSPDADFMDASVEVSHGNDIVLRRRRSNR